MTEALSTVVTIVSGLPRSGTSMMMKMLEAGGMRVLRDEIRKPDEDNPGGYYEYERVKRTKNDGSWLEEARGKAVKMVSRLLYDLPSDRAYKVIFMRRDMDEVLRSQRRMLERLGAVEESVADEEEIAELFRKHLEEVAEWVARQENFEVLYVDYNHLLADTNGSIEEIDRFLGRWLNMEKMASVVDQSLYRQKR